MPLYMRNFSFLLLLFLFNIAHSQSITLDNSFGTGGYSSFAIQNINKLTNTLMLPDGQFITGYVRTTSSRDYVILKKVSANGILDNVSFGSFDLPGVMDFKKMVIQNNMIIVLGSYASTYPYNRSEAMIVRFNLNGDVDTTFGNSGYKLFSYSNVSSDSPIDIFTDDLNNTYIYSSYGANSSSVYPNYYLIKLGSDDSVDTTFGVNGRLDLHYYNPYDASSDTRIMKALLQNDGKLILAGAKKNATTNIWEAYMERKLLDGSSDTNFGNNGEIIFPNSEHSIIKNFEYDYSDNSILILNEYDNSNSSRERVYLSKIDISDGSLITSFANNGMTTQYMFPDAPRLNLQHLKTLSNGKVLVVGSVSNFSASPSINTQLFVMSFNADGTLNYSTSSNGFHIFATTPPSSSLRADYVNNLFNLSDGTFIIAYSGYSATSGAYSYLAKFNASTLGINEISSLENSHYKVFPNPSNDYIIITNNKNSEEYFNYEIIDLRGRVEKTGKSRLNEEIKISDLSKGVHILNSELEGGNRFSRKIIVN